MSILNRIHTSPRLPVWALRAMCVIGLAVDAYGAHRFGWV